MTKPHLINDAMEWLSRIAFGTASLVLMAMSLALAGFATTELYGAATRSQGEFGDALLSAIGYVVIAMAVFDVAKGLHRRGSHPRPGNANCIRGEAQPQKRLNLPLPPLHPNKSFNRFETTVVASGFG